MSKKVLVTGVTGQDGSYMVDYLLANTDYEIYGMVRRTSKPDYSNLKDSIKNKRLKLVVGDLSDSQSIDNLVREIKPDYFINLAAQSFVASSWKIPEQTFDIDAIGVIRCLEAIRKHVPNCRFYNAGCHDEETKVITKDGIKNYKDIKIGDMVYSINQATNQLELKPVDKIFEYDYDDYLFEFKNGGLMVTPNHKMIYKTARGHLLSKTAEEFINLSDVKYPINKPVSGKFLPETVDLSEFIPIQKKKGNKSYGKHITKINAYDLMHLIGLYIGDGSSRILKKKVHVECAIADRGRDIRGRYRSPISDIKYEQEYLCPQAVIDIPPTDPAYGKLINILEKNGIKYSLHGQCDVTFHQWGLSPYFSECGNSASTKHIPKWIFDLDSSYQMKVLEGIIDSDGDDRGCISTCSKKLQEDLVILHINCGIIPSIRERGPRVALLKDGRTIKGNFPEYSVTGLKENTGYQRGKYNKVKYKGKVWCLEVKDNHNFLVERKGRITFSGNSSEEFGDVRYAPQDMKHPLRARSPYGAAKIAARHIVKVYRESYNLYAVQGLLFNHESERRGEEFVTRKITLGIARILKELENGNTQFEPIELGNLDAKRDWSHAEDFVRGIWMMLNQEKHLAVLKNKLNKDMPETGILNMEREWLNIDLVPYLKEYLLASGETHSIREFIEKAFAVVGIKGQWDKGLFRKAEDEKFVFDYRGKQIPLVIVNPEFYRPAEVELLLGDPTDVKNELGWIPQVSFDKLVKRMVLNDVKGS